MRLRLPPINSSDFCRGTQRRQQQAKMRDKKWEDLPKVLMVSCQSGISINPHGPLKIHDFQVPPDNIFGSHFGNFSRSQLKLQPFFRSCWEIPVWCKRIMEDLRVCLLSFTVVCLVRVAGLWYVSSMFRSLDPLLIFNVSSVLLDSSLPKNRPKRWLRNPLWPNSWPNPWVVVEWVFERVKAEQCRPSSLLDGSHQHNRHFHAIKDAANQMR